MGSMGWTNGSETFLNSVGSLVGQFFCVQSGSDVSESHLWIILPCVSFHLASRGRTYDLLFQKFHRRLISVRVRRVFFGLNSALGPS